MTHTQVSDRKYRQVLAELGEVKRSRPSETRSLTQRDVILYLSSLHSAVQFGRNVSLHVLCLCTSSSYNTEIYT